MKIRYHISMAAVVVAAETWNTLWRLDVEGTGQPASELLRLGYDKMWVASILPWDWVTIALLAAFVGLSGLSIHSKGRLRKCKSRGSR